MPSAPKCTANNAGWNDKAVQEIVRIPKTVKHHGVDIVTCIRTTEAPRQKFGSPTLMTKPPSAAY
ncbi:hypothetical protein TRECRb3_34960 [Escherichia coli]|nr:hypothetical protein TRECRb3_34960 [Escherichia coli]